MERGSAAGVTDDAAHAALPARLGGDEFTVLLTGLHGADGAEIVAKRILAVLENPFDIDGVEMTMGASIGIAIGQGTEMDFETLLGYADKAMYNVKSRGKNSYEIRDLSADA